MAVKQDTKGTPPLYVLPSDNKDLQSFSQKFKVDMMGQVIKTISFAIEHEQPIVEVFQFKNSDFVITLQEKDYLTNLNNIYEYCMKNEIYEQCSDIVKLQQLLKNKIIKND
jgi:hypothetical protein